ncbi:EAL domain-containing protein [Aliidiomarina haloalkalitolerans]|uniref:Bifunctional diguanylate cyclase/phosphodiesterase n=1 Tax=Aliidiomarina haloalkalitolerans TaxID=859059 RepID=A0A432VUH5_9GAMM|nr:EAL domain-containing protein [Aliidiomarina haloalkalitolerans]RUO20177.1 bifunctional diguanylate cyclase/phosphodiesterase [Aliidiomarina haloalkalitolerans]
MPFLQFITEQHDLASAYAGSHAAGLVALSVAIAILASYVSLLHTKLMQGATTSQRRSLWHLNGAVAMGAGVWAMHFLGMVSFKIDTTVLYSPLITAISVIPAIFAAWITLWVLHHGQDRWRAILFGGVMMGAGIGVMHYTGMAAIRTQAEMLYLPSMFAISIVVAVVLAVIALAARKLLRPVIVRSVPRIIVSAVIMGFAISSMHYTAMHATVFLPAAADASLMPLSGADSNLIVMSALSVAIFIVILSAVVVVLMNRQQRLSIQATSRGERVRELTERLQSVADRIPGMVYQLHRDNSGFISFRYLSDAVQDLFAVNVNEAINDARTVLSKVPLHERELIFKSLQESAEKLSPWNYEFPVEVSLHKTRWLSATSVPQKESDGGVSWSGFISDVTEKRKTEQTIKELAYSDTLTGLPNRRSLHDELTARIELLAKHQAAVAVLIVNLDNFKRVNDVHGQKQGDAVLQEATRRLQSVLSERSFLARVTADEFVVVTEFTTAEQARAECEVKAAKMLEVLREPFDLPSLRHQCTASIGVVITDNSWLGAEELLRRADLAAGNVKTAGGDNFSYYHPSIEKEISARFPLENDLRAAVGTDQLVLYYQLQANEQGQFIGAEALVRWMHPTRGLVSPAEFIPLAEESGLIVPIGTQVLRQACLQLAAWQQQESTRHLSMSVNVSAKQFYQLNFVEQVLAIVSDTKVPPHLLKLELTESLVLEDMELVLTSMHRLKQQGICFSMDDFGTGYSALSYLSQLPFDEVKIDQAFIRRASMAEHQRDWTIVNAIIHIAQDLGMDVIAEGVETKEQQERLAASGCLRYQGFYFSRPAPVNELPL